MKKSLAILGGGAAAVAMGAGLFAWTANTVSVDNVVAAGTSGIVQACTTDALVVTQDTAVYSGGAWTVQGATVANSGTGATACNGMDVTLTALDGAGDTLANATVANITVTSGAFSSVFDLTGSPVAMTDLSKWTVVIK